MKTLWAGFVSSVLTISAIYNGAVQAAPADIANPALKHVDLRDLTRYNTYLAGTANLISTKLEENAGQFLGPVDVSTKSIANLPTHVIYTKVGAQGPVGRNGMDEYGKSIFQIDYDSAENTRRANARRNTIFSAEIEDIVEEMENKIFKLKLILFVQDNGSAFAATSKGYYFRRLWVRVNWAVPATDPARFQVLEHVEDIRLSDTQFQVRGDLLERKLILEEPTKRIYKVFPIGVGSFMIQTEYGMDGSVRLMTGEYPNSLMRRATGSGYDPNTRSRIWNDYYRGRPFLSLFLNGDVYKGIGLHYQISDDAVDENGNSVVGSGLLRGFVSHGCIRVRDKDLYQLDSILNDGPHETISAHVVNHLDSYYDQFEHPQTKLENGYGLEVYQRADASEQVFCEGGGVSSYNTRRVAPGYYTVAGQDCLTKTAWRNASVREVINYMIDPYNYPAPRTEIVDPFQGQPLDLMENGEFSGFDNAFENDRPARTNCGRRNLMTMIFGGGRDCEETDSRGQLPPANIGNGEARQVSRAELNRMRTDLIAYGQYMDSLNCRQRQRQGDCPRIIRTYNNMYNDYMAAGGQP